MVANSPTTSPRRRRIRSSPLPLFFPGGGFNCARICDDLFHCRSDSEKLCLQSVPGMGPFAILASLPSHLPMPSSPATRLVGTDLPDPIVMRLLRTINALLMPAFGQTKCRNSVQGGDLDHRQGQSLQQRAVRFLEPVKTAERREAAQTQ